MAVPSSSSLSSSRRKQSKSRLTAVQFIMLMVALAFGTALLLSFSVLDSSSMTSSYAAMNFLTVTNNSNVSIPDEPVLVQVVTTPQQHPETVTQAPLPPAQVDKNQQQQQTKKSVVVPAPATAHHCLNDDFQPQHKAAVWSMLNDNQAYVRGAIKLGKGVKQHTKTPVDLVVMELESKPLTPEEWKDLHQVGWMRCSVKSIPPPPNAKKTRTDLREKFAVLHVWAMTVYETVLFLDADTYVQNSLDHLIAMDLQGKPVGVTKDIRGGKWVDTFNSGVMVLHPSIQEHERLYELLQSGMEFEYVMSDQGFLNAVYKDNWHEIGFVNNANLALYKFQRDFWNQYALKDINVIHYTMQKPWKCKSKGPYGPICDVWINSE